MQIFKSLILHGALPRICHRLTFKWFTSMKIFNVCKISFYVITLLFCVHVLPCIAKENPESDDAFAAYKELDNDFVKFSREYYRLLLSTRHFEAISNIRTLADKAENQYKGGNISDSAGLIIRNIATVKNNINTKAIIQIVNILLEASELKTAENILNLAKQESDPSLVSSILFTFAKYYYSRGDWNKVINLTGKIANDLPPEDYQHAMFMEGMSLQKLQKHRKAIVIYQKIPKDSRFYTNARINIAVSDFRQDWWTDAHTIIYALLKDPEIRNNKELTDRLHTMTGYSFLQLEYFRNSRDAFRNVSIDGNYTNQALIGISLDAAYQKDYVGALNAATALNKKHETDIESEESYLLLPYFYEKLHQNATASAGYTNAIKYYENKLQTIHAAMLTEDAYFKNAAFTQSGEFNLHGETIDLTRVLPSSFFSQYRLLNSYRHHVQQINNHNLSGHLRQITNSFAKTMKIASVSVLDKRARYITDYMNQCRYGLARMYDNNSSTLK